MAPFEQRIRSSRGSSGAGCAGEDAERVRELVADRIDGDRVRWTRRSPIMPQGKEG